MWGLQKYQNNYEILFGRGCIDLENSAILLLLAQGNLPPFGFFEDCNITKYLTNIFLLWINVNRLCSHVGLEFWTLNSFMCPKLTIFTTWKFRFTTLYYWIGHELLNFSGLLTGHKVAGEQPIRKQHLGPWPLL